MPNIEIRGFSPEESDKMKETIDRILSEIDLSAEAITSIMPMAAQSCDEKRTPQPYLRICSEKKREIDKVASALKRNGVAKDVECLLLYRYISASDMLS